MTRSSAPDFRRKSGLLHALDSHKAAQQQQSSGSKPPSSPLETSRTLNIGTSKDTNARLMEEARIRHARNAIPGSSQASADALFMATGLNSGFQLPGSGGFSLHYDDASELRSVDIGGPDQAQRMTEFVTNAIDNLSHGLSTQHAYEELGLRDKKDLIPGLEVRLLPHQAIGVAWMLKREQHRDRGGILADDMGLGKTIQMIATMVRNAPPMDEEWKTTLIVVPAALLQQWKEEIESRTNDVFTVHVHHGKDKLKKVSELKEKDVVITTYQTLSQDFQIPKTVDEVDAQDWLAEHGGVLARARFYRAVVDEAQFIRNRSTIASLSLAHVRAKYRWLLTGTPVTNTLADIYGLIRFGRFRPWNDWNDFNEHVAKVQAKDALLAGERARAILKPLILRRTKDSELDGQPILQLPEKHIDLVTLEFSKDEREIYTAFENKTQVQINKFIKAGTLMKNNVYVLALLLRLRQLCCHPHLTLALSEDGDDPTNAVGDGAEKELSRARKVMGDAWVDSIKRRLLLRARVAEGLVKCDDVDPTNCPKCKEVFTGDAGRVLTCGHEVCLECLTDMHMDDITHDGIFGEGSEKENMAREKEYENARTKGLRPCPTCKKMLIMKGSKIFKSIAFEPSDEEVNATKKKANNKGKNKRVFELDSDDDIVEVKPKIKSEFKFATSEDVEMDFDEMLADSDDDLMDPNLMFQKLQVKEKGKPKKKRVKMEHDDDSDVEIVSSTNTTPAKKLRAGIDSDSDLEVTPSRPKGKYKSPKKKSNLGKGDKSMGISSAVVSIWKKGDDDLIPSAKMVEMLALLKEWAPTGDKTILYSQWTANLDLIEKLFSRHGIRNLRFDGSMDRMERDRVLHQFKDPSGPKVILISTRAGSVGLNLVSANRVINMDLSWNYAAESQAYDRAHRIGQEKEVFIKRLVIADTIEERMLQLQEVKVGLAEAALGEGNGSKLKKFSVKDIKFLFGMSKDQDKKKKQPSTPDMDEDSD